MTADPFKSRRFVDDSQSMHNPYQQSYSSLPVSFSNQSLHNIKQDSKLNLSNLSSNNKQEPNQESTNRQAYLQAHYEANKDLIAQLKANIDLLYKGAKIFGQFSLYPLRAIRWQCQIHYESNKFHLTPFTLIPVYYNLNYSGFMALYKGCFSIAAYTGIFHVIESILSELTLFEKNTEDVNRLNKVYGHLALKFITCAITTPIYSAAFYESVQSGIVKENLGLIDLLKETWNRVTGYRYNYRTRLIPIWSLIMPTSAYFMGIHFLSFGFEKLFRRLIPSLINLFEEKRRMYETDEVEQEIVENPYMNALAQCLSQAIAIVALYPIETVLNRLIVQGTRTIIDNTDLGYRVVPINTRYDGFFDCAQMINETEGIFGFYKGLGNIFFETLLQYAILKIVKLITYRIYDSEWVTRCDNTNIKNLMSSS